MTETVMPGEALPFPPRFWWLKRILVSGGALLLLFFAVRLWWGWVAHARLEAVIAKYKAAGEPIEPEDFDPKERVIDAENVALMLQEAEAQLPSLDLRKNWMIDYGCRSRGTWEVHRPEIASVLQEHRRAFELAREARRFEKVDWEIRLRSPIITTLLINFTAERQIARAMGAAARHDHLSGNDHAAIEKLRDLLAQANAIEQHPTFVAYLVASSVNARAITVVEEVAGSLTLREGGPVDGSESGAASRAQVRALIDDLLDQQSRQDAFVRAMMVERAIQLDVVRLFLRGQWVAVLGGLPTPASALLRGLAFPIRPLHEGRGVEALKFMDRWVAAAQSSNWKKARTIAPREDELGPLPSDSLISGVLRPFRWAMSNLDRFGMLHYRSIASKRMAATALAIRLFVEDHGRLPARLEELVPNYLPSVPLDSFGDEGEPIHYLPENQPPILYSVGQDGTDDGGRYELRSNGSLDLEKFDFPFFLDGNLPLESIPELPESRTQALDDEINETGDQGNADEGQNGDPEP